MTGRRWPRRLAFGSAAVAAAIAIGIVIGAAMGLFSGKRPANLGFAQGAFVPGDGRPNWVSSTVSRDDSHYTAPLAYQGDPVAAWSKLRAAVGVQPGATIVRNEPGYLHVEFASAGLGFVDDGQFALDAAAGVVHVKSGARLGIRDFSVNRDRIEAIRKAFSS